MLGIDLARFEQPQRPCLLKVNYGAKIEKKLAKNNSFAKNRETRTPLVLTPFPRQHALRCEQQEQVAAVIRKFEANEEKSRISKP